MAVTIINIPPSASLVESPVMFQIQDTTEATTSSSFQFVCDLYTWQGDITTDKPSTPSYILNKFPVSDYQGQPGTIFDVSPILSSTMSSSLADVYQGTFAQPIHLPRWYTAEFYGKYLDTTTQQYVTTSHEEVSGWGNFVALDGFNLWGEKSAGFNEPFSSSVDRYPILSTIPNDATASLTDLSIPYYFSVYALRDNSTQGQVSKAVISNDAPIVSSTYTIDLDTTDSYTTSSRIAPNTTIDPYMFATASADGASTVTIEIQDASNNPIGEQVNIDISQCTKEYPAVRIVFKNRYGAFDQFEFPLVSRKGFTTSVKSYKQNALETPLFASYDTFKGESLYYTDAQESLIVNTDYVDEKFNDFFKGLLVSDEIYLVQAKPPETAGDDGLGATFLPLVLTNNTVQLKTGVVDKLIQYTFEFRFSTPYKLTL